jgi:hypothetical protein
MVSDVPTGDFFVVVTVHTATYSYLRWHKTVTTTDAIATATSPPPIIVLLLLALFRLL